MPGTDLKRGYFMAIGGLPVIASAYYEPLGNGVCGSVILTAGATVLIPRNPTVSLYKLQTVAGQAFEQAGIIERVRFSAPQQ